MKTAGKETAVAIYRHSRKRLLLGALPVLGGMLIAAVALFGRSGEHAQAHHEVGHPTVQTLARADFPDQVAAQFKLRLAGTKAQRVIQVPDASEVVVLKITFEPGDNEDHDRIPWHTHPGPAIVAVASGELTITNASDCVPRVYAAGEAFLDPGGTNVHRADNWGTEDAVVYVTFLGIPAGSGPTIPVEDPGC